MTAHPKVFFLQRQAESPSEESRERACRYHISSTHAVDCPRFHCRGSGGGTS